MYIHPFHVFVNLFPFLSFSVSSTGYSPPLFSSVLILSSAVSLSYTLHSPFYLSPLFLALASTFSIHFSIVPLAVYRALGSLFSHALLLSLALLAYLHSCHSLVQLSSFFALFLAIPVARRLPAVNFFGILISLFLLYFN